MHSTPQGPFRVIRGGAAARYPFVDVALTHYSRAHVMRSTGQPLAAEASYRAALVARPGYPAAANNLGTLLLEGGRLDEAEG
eukprot:892742-Prorocentrum_minimum.AAC.1